MRVLTLTAAALAVLVTPAHADEDAGDDDPGFNMLAVNMGFGALPVDGAQSLAMSLGLGIEHPVFPVTRVFGEYDWLWLSRRSDRPSDVMEVVSPGSGGTRRTPEGSAETIERHGTGHRASLGLRRELTAKGTGSTRLFLDGELGATFAITNDNVQGVTTLPGGFAGLRVGYDTYTDRDASPSHTFELAVHLRAIAVADGVGLSGGITMAWGN